VGDVAMLEHEVTPVLKVLRSIASMLLPSHHGMTEVQPTVVFLHYYGTRPAEQLASAYFQRLARERGLNVCVADRDH
jgi:hypothetical protein